MCLCFSEIHHRVLLLLSGWKLCLWIMLRCILTHGILCLSFQFENDIPAHYNNALAGMESMYDPHRTSIPSGHTLPTHTNHGPSLHQYPPYSTSSSMSGMANSTTQDSQLKRDKDSVYG